MPARTNEFQEMVALLTQIMREDESMTVTPSKMLPDVITGKLREVDVAVETTVAGRKVTVGIECRDWKDPQSIGWVEEMHGKHLDLPIQLTMLVSSSGFTESALAKAKHYRIETVTPGEVTPGFVGSVVNNLDKVVTKRAHWKVKTVLLQIEMADGDLPWVPTFADSPVYTHDGTEVAEVGDIVRGMLDDNPAQKAHLRSATEKDKFMNLKTIGPTDENGGPLYVIPTEKGIELAPAPIVGMHIEGPVDLDLVEVPLKHGNFDGTPYSSGSTPYEGMRVSVAATESEDGAVKWAGSVTEPGGIQQIF
ncbi:hypothetical protein ACQ86B_13625 [Mycolicibacterium aichiense]|uniref:hypothetical protein n=1 Tax=Mycolicibacterium aichiense TaxID=1799 RepID=UPI003D67AB30